MTRSTCVFLAAIAIALPAAGAVAGAASDRPSAAKGGPVASSTSVLGAAWHDDNSPIKGAHVQLRNVLTGRVESTAVANDAGQFTFTNVEGGTYIVELVTDNGKVLTVGHPFTIAPGETVATFVRLGTKIPWFQTFFSNAATAATSSAASEGITAIAPVARPATAGQ